MKQAHQEDQIRAAIQHFTGSNSPVKPTTGGIGAVYQATEQLPLSNLNYWERWLRHESYHHWDDQWQVWIRRRRPRTWLDLCSHNGYDREAALQTLTGPAPSRFLLALAVRRLNDWVPQVRAAARAKLPQLIQTSNPEHVVDVLVQALTCWHTWERMQAPDRQTILDLLTLPEIADRLRHKILSDSTGPWPTVFAQIGRSTVWDQHLQEIAIKAVQPSVRVKSYQALLTGKMTWLEGRRWEWTDIRYCKGRLVPVHGSRPLQVDTSASFLDILHQASLDRSSFVRRLAASTLISALPTLGEQAHDLARRFAADTAHPVAERGRFALQRLASP